LADWVKHGGVLVFCDKDADPYLQVHDWWNSDGKNYTTPRKHLFEALGVADSIAPDEFHAIGNGGLIWMRERPADLTTSAEGAARVVSAAKLAAQKAGLTWRETNYLLLRRGYYVIASGLDEPDDSQPHPLAGRFASLFDSELKVQNGISITPGSRQFLLDLDAARTGKPHVLASACKALLKTGTDKQLTFGVEGIDQTPGILLLESPDAPREITLDGKPLSTFEYSTTDHLLWIHFDNKAEPQELSVNF
jgi:hypothetical protein